MEFGTPAKEAEEWVERECEIHIVQLTTVAVYSKGLGEPQCWFKARPRGPEGA